MDYTKLSELIKQDVSVKEIAKHFNKSITTVRYWINKYKIQVTPDKSTRCCPRCKVTKPINEFYDRRGKVGGSPYCKPCTNAQSSERSKAFKKKCVDYKGGKCVCCGYNKSISALQFHHLNPEEKDFTIAEVKGCLFENIQAELDKCILLCANCHSEYHAGDTELPT